MVISERTPVPPRYRLIEEVGQGGMAVVYRAQDETLQREVAVKVLHPHLSADIESKARLEREAQAVAKLGHPNIIEIFDYSGRDGASAFIVTEFIHGQTLKQFLQARATSHFPEIAALIAAELAGALAHAHRSGIIHRDIKPENVMIREDGLLKLMDFGIAQVIDLERMTVTGQLLGSPAYMSPELIEGRPLDVRTDVFGLGILLYQLGTGNLPFSGKNPHEVLRKISEGRFPDARPANRGIGEGLWKIMARALAPEPANRHASMAELAGELEQYLSECGLSQTTAELGAYFADPELYEKNLPARMTLALMATAERCLSQRNTPRAMQCWNRILAYDSANERVMAALERMERRSRIRMYGGFAVAGTGLAVLIALLSKLLASSPAEEARARLALAPAAAGQAESAARRRAAAAAAAAPARPLAAPSPGKPGEPGGGRPERVASRAARSRARLAGERGGPGSADDMPSRAEDEPATRPGPAPTSGGAAARTFTLGPTPQNVDVFMDGQRQFAYDTDHRTLTVPWNSDHVIELRSPAGCCFAERIEVGPDHPVPADGIIARKLKWKPARLVVSLLPQGTRARIMVRDASGSGRGSVVEPGEETNVPFFATDEGQKEVEVSIDAEGGLTRERVLLRAGESKSIVVDLQAQP